MDTMAFHVRDPATDAAVRAVARLTGKTLTETIRDAAERDYAAISATTPLIERLQAIQAQFQAMKQPGGQAADRAFFDELSDDS
jgi:antitoxin VapB